MAAPRDLRGKVTLFARELASDQVLEGLLASIGLASRLDGERLVVAHADPAAAAATTGMMNACEIPSQVSTSRRLGGPGSVPEMTAAELELVGLARAGDQWLAYTVTPTRLLHKIETGYELLDAKVDSVGPAGVRLSLGAGGVMELPLQP